MARPRKNGLDYFPFDVDFFDDEKIVAIAGEFGVKGEIAAIKLLCAIYRNGYFIEWNEMLLMKLLRQLPGLSSELMSQIVMRLVKWGFFNKDLFDSASILTSQGIQKRYFDAIKKRVSINDDLPYILGFRSGNPPKTLVPAAEIPPKHEFSPEKLHKVKEIKDNIKLSNSPSLRVREDELLQRFDGFAKEIIDGSFPIWQEQIKGKYHIADMKDAVSRFRQYAIETVLLEKIKDTEDFQRFFVWKIRDFLNETNENDRRNAKRCSSGKGYTTPDCGLHEGKRE